MWPLMSAALHMRCGASAGQAVRPRAVHPPALIWGIPHGVHAPATPVAPLQPPPVRPDAPPQPTCMSFHTHLDHDQSRRRGPQDARIGDNPLCTAFPPSTQPNPTQPNPTQPASLQDSTPIELEQTIGCCPFSTRSSSHGMAHCNSHLTMCGLITHDGQKVWGGAVQGASG